MKLPGDYGNEEEHKKIHPILLPKTEEVRVVLKDHLATLAKAAGICTKKRKSHGGLKLPKVEPGMRQTSVFNSQKYGSRNRPYQEMKKDTKRSQYPTMYKEDT